MGQVNNHKIIYTETDEAPMLATYSLLPIIQAFTKHCEVNIIKEDISLSARILAAFPESLSSEQKTKDSLKELGELVHDKEANIIKLPNISASIPQLQDAIKELQDKGYSVPKYPLQVNSEKEQKIRDKYNKVIGSAVNPVLREGNSDRRVARAVKNYAKNNPHRVGKWSKNSKTHVSHMSQSDFFENEQSKIIKESSLFTIEFTSKTKEKVILKQNIPVTQNEIVDISVMRMKELKTFFEKNIEDAKNKNVLLSLHLKSTMMKVSDPIIFGCAVSQYYKEVFEYYKDTFKEIGINPNNGIAEIYQKITVLDKQ